MDAEKILEGLSQEERLALLERLLKGAARQEEDLSTAERVERLEEILLGRRRGFSPWWARWRTSGWTRGATCPCPCCW